MVVEVQQDRVHVLEDELIILCHGERLLTGDDRVKGKIILSRQARVHFDSPDRHITCWDGQAVFLSEVQVCTPSPCRSWKHSDEKVYSSVLSEWHRGLEPDSKIGPGVAEIVVHLLLGGLILDPIGRLEHPRLDEIQNISPFCDHGVLSEPGGGVDKYTVSINEREFSNK